MEPCTTMESYFNGMRVTGDKRWTREESKTGTGYLGTITGCEKRANKRYYTVTWDSGPITEVEHPGPDVLIVLDSRPFGEEHNERCWWCRIFIIGFLWECITCGNKSLCNNCYHEGKHELKHKFQRWDIKREGTSNVHCQKCKETISKVVLYCADCNANFCNGCYFNGVDSHHEKHTVTKKSAPQAKFWKVVGTRQSGKALLKGIVEKAQVTYSAEKEANYSDSDGLPTGKVTNICRDNRDDKFVSVIVQWPRKACKASYSLGYKGKVDLRYVKSAGMPCYPYHLPSPWELEETMQMSKQLKKKEPPKEPPLQRHTGFSYILDPQKLAARQQQVAAEARTPSPPLDDYDDIPNAEVDLELKDVGVVQKPYQARDHGEATLTPGDLVMDVYEIENDIYHLTGTINGREGIFPQSHVKIIKVSPDEHERLLKQDEKHHENREEFLPNDTTKIEAKAVFAYEPQSLDELPLRVGDIIHDISFSADGWAQGSIKGYIPTSYIVQIENNHDVHSDRDDSYEDTSDTDSTTDINDEPTEAVKRSFGVPHEDADNIDTRTVQSETVSNGTTCMTLEDYIGDNDDELSFKSGAVIRNVIISSGKYWKGNLRTRTGTFPRHLVKIISDESDARSSETMKTPPPTPAKPKEKPTNKVPPQVLHTPSTTDHVWQTDVVRPKVIPKRESWRPSFRRTTTDDDQSKPFSSGDEVIINVNKGEAKKLQQGHGGWKDWMDQVFSETATVKDTNRKGSVLVTFKTFQGFMNPKILQRK